VDAERALSLPLINIYDNYTSSTSNEEVVRVWITKTQEKYQGYNLYMDEYQAPKREMSSSSLLQNYRLPVPQKKYDFEYQELGDEMQKHFTAGQVWPLFYKYSVDSVRRAWIAYQKQPIKKYPYFLGILKKTCG
jgi:hypothetical protein